MQELKQMHMYGHKKMEQKQVRQEQFMEYTIYQEVHGKEQQD